jgi:myo-inositol-1-phosphate synthase
MGHINIAIVGAGNCASALIQGLYYYRRDTPEETAGLTHWNLGGYRPTDISVVAAFDIDERKVGKDVNKAVFSPPNCAKVFYPDLPDSGISVQMGNTLDGVSEHMREYDDQHTFIPASKPIASKKQIVDTLKNSGAEIVVNYLPVGSQQATEFYAECALEAGAALINCIPVFIASNPTWARRFKAMNIPLIGDDVKSQIGATIVHRTLTDLFRRRGTQLERTYQLNTGGNTDFLNMLNRKRLSSKKKSKTEAVQSVTSQRLASENIHIGPSDYVPWQKDNKVAFIRMEGKLFGDVPMHLELRLSVEDSPNSAGVVVDAIRCARIALDRGEGGVLEAPSANFCKHPPIQFTDDQAHQLLEDFISRPAESPKVRSIFNHLSRKQQLD